MKHIFRFFGEKSDQGWEISELDQTHIVRVLRLPDEESIELFNGEGLVASGKVSYLSSKKVTFIADTEQVITPDSRSICLMVGALKPGFIDDLLPSIIELETDQIHVVIQQSTSKNRINEKVFERWNKIIISSCKQCKRAYLPKIFSWNSIAEFLQSDLAKGIDKKLLMLPGSDFSIDDLKPKYSSVIAAIGGEKGFTAEEEELLKSHDYVPTVMGSSILRAYTACIAVTAILSTKFKKA